MVSIRDQFQRPLRDLRISVTDRCNFRCVYCMPKEIFGRDFQFLDKDELLTFEEITRLAGIFSELGVRKIRVTGGEPLVRQEVERLVEMLAEIPGIELTMTSNGLLLPKKAKLLRKAGLDRITISLDALDDETFQAMNDVGVTVDKVLEGIRAADEAGLNPIKINMVVKRGVNEHSILPMARYFRAQGHILRFIEYMDVGNTNGWRMDQVVPAAEIVAKISAELPAEPIDPNYRGEVANRYRYLDGRGEFGIIASVTQPFCGDCTRLRLSAEGKLYTCLFSMHGHDIRAALREGDTDQDIAERLRSLWSDRTDRYSEIRSSETADLPKVEMSYIGG